MAYVPYHTELNKCRNQGVTQGVVVVVVVVVVLLNFSVAVMFELKVMLVHTNRLDTTLS